MCCRKQKKNKNKNKQKHEKKKKSEEETCCRSNAEDEGERRARRRRVVESRSIRRSLKKTYSVQLLNLCSHTKDLQRQQILSASDVNVQQLASLETPMNFQPRQIVIWRTRDCATYFLKHLTGLALLGLSVSSSRRRQAT